MRKDMNNSGAKLMILCLMMVVSSVNASGNSVEEWEGCYANKSILCTEPGTGEDCSDEFSDSLKIEATENGYLVELHSTQANYHICEFSMRMEVEHDALVQRTPYGELRVGKSNGALEIFSKGIDPTASGLGVCGAYANIDSLRFYLKSTIGNKACAMNRDDIQADSVGAVH